MTLTSAEHSQINRNNARNSSGPKTPEGKANSRQNAMKHGLRATILALPSEDPDAIQAREDSWNDFYQPQSPAAHHLVNQCARATVLSDRVDHHHAAMLTRDIREAQEQWDRRRENDVEFYTRQLKTDPRAAVVGLRHSAMGCRYLISRWERLERLLNEDQWWSRDERDEAIRMMGHNPAKLSESGEAWTVALFCGLMVQPADEPLMEWLFSLPIRPTCTLALIKPDDLPNEEQTLRWLHDLVADHLGPLIEREERLRTQFDDPDRAEAGDRLLIPDDATSARLFLRYQTEARTSFHRAYSELVKTLARDKAEAEEAAENGASPNEPNCDANNDSEMSSEDSVPPDPGSDGAEPWVSSVVPWATSPESDDDGSEMTPIGPADACSA
jgi:hypothetical protein